MLPKRRKNSVLADFLKRKVEIDQFYWKLVFWFLTIYATPIFYSFWFSGVAAAAEGADL